MIVGSVRKISLVALLVATAALLVPGGAQAAAPQVYCIVAYGHENPGNCDPQPNLNAPAYQGRIYPTSQPYGYGEKGLLFVEGVTEASGSSVSGTVTVTKIASVAISATDGVATVSRTVHSTGTGAFKADLKVMNLGIHESTGTNLNGISTLTVTTVTTFTTITTDTAPDPDTTVTTVETSAPKTTTIDKYALAPGDEVLDRYKPILSKLSFPPSEWCHLPVSSIGRTRIFGLVEPGAAVCSANEDQSGEIDGTPILICGDGAYDYCVTVVNGKGSTGQASLSGLVEDDHAAAYGHAGEIAKVNVKITQGTTLIRNYGNVANRVNSTQAKWDITLKIDDYEPNAVSGDDSYLITVEVFDAKGNKVTLTSTFNVYPF